MADEPSLAQREGGGRQEKKQGGGCAMVGVEGGSERREKAQ